MKEGLTHDRKGLGGEGLSPHTPVNVKVYQVGSRHANEASITE